MQDAPHEPTPSTIGQTMRAIVQDRYGSIADLRVANVPCPTLSDDEVLVKVMATSVHADVWHVVTGRPRILRLLGNGVFRPRRRVPGTDLAGIVCAVGNGVAEFQPGDAVFGEALLGMQWTNGGTYAQYAAANVRALAKMPDNVSFEQAAAVPTAGYIALLNLTGAVEIAPAHEVLINGAGGAVGGIALQYAKSRGARVTAVEHTSKLDFVRQLGADDALDYTKSELDGCATRFDVILDVASTMPTKLWSRLLAPGGKFVLIGHDHYGAKRRPWLGELPTMFSLMFRSIFDKRLPMNFAMPEKKDVMETLRTLLQSGQLRAPIGRLFPLERAPAALEALTRGDVIGRIVLTPHGD